MLIALAIAGCAPNSSSPVTSIPYLERRGEAVQLMVDGKPFLALAGELHNSSASTAAYMEPIFPFLKEGGLNTVLAVVSWEQIESQEDVFDCAATRFRYSACGYTIIKIQKLEYFEI